MVLLEHPWARPALQLGKEGSPPPAAGKAAGVEQKMRWDGRQRGTV